MIRLGVGTVCNSLQQSATVFKIKKKGVGTACNSLQNFKKYKKYKKI